MKHQGIISKLTLEEKCCLRFGKDFWQSRRVKTKRGPNMALSDGPHGIRKQEGADISTRWVKSSLPLDLTTRMILKTGLSLSISTVCDG